MMNGTPMVGRRRLLWLAGLVICLFLVTCRMEATDSRLAVTPTPVSQGVELPGVVFAEGVVEPVTAVAQSFQLGGQVYSEFIMFKDEVAFQHFTRGNFEMGAQASAVAINLGASADANYDKGVAVFTIAEGGLMYEASIGGQKFKYKPAKK